MTLDQQRRKQTEMPQEFDPYHKWLGIAPRDQPPHHYRLLGIDTFEDDRDVVDAAANRVMSYLKELAIGDDTAYSQKLLNEVAQVRICLLNPTKRAAYDEDLRAKLSPQKLPPPTTPVAPPAKAIPLPVPLPMSPPKAVASTHPMPVAVRVGKTPVQRLRRKHKWPMPLVVGGVSVLSAVVLLAVVLLADRGDSPSTPSSRGVRSMTTGSGADSNSRPNSRNATPTREKEYAGVKAKMLTADDSNEAARLACEILQVHNPCDAEARDVYGKWLCLEKGDWSDGLEQLSLGSDGDLRNAATQDLTGATDAPQRLRFGEAWHRLAASDESLSGFQARANYWYDLALESEADTSNDSGAVERAGRVLEINPDHPKANSVIGKQLCLTEDDWIRGLSLLAKGADAELRDVAIQDLADPSTPSERVHLGDAFYQLASSDTSLEDFLPRARHWYQLALPDLDDAERERVLKLLAPHLARTEKEHVVALLEPRLTQEEIAVVRKLLQIDQQTPGTMLSSSWKPLADEGELTDCYTLGSNHNAMRPAVLLWLSDPKAALKKGISFEWKPAHAYQADEKQQRSGQKGYTFAGPDSGGHFTLYKFQIHSDADQQVELIAATYAAAGSRNVLAVSIDGIRLRKNRLTVPLREGEHVVLVDLAHSGSLNPDNSWMRVTLEGKEPISQMAVP
jgi:hypothetical protein